MGQTIDNFLKNEKNNEQPITLVSMRCELLYSIRDLSDLEYQKREWLQNSNGYKFYNSLYMVIDFLFDDRDLENNPEVQIGYCIRNKEELGVITPVIVAIDMILRKTGHDKKDNAYWGSELWLDVVYKAGVAYEYIKNQGLDDKYIEFIERTSKQDNSQK